MSALWHCDNMTEPGPFTERRFTIFCTWSGLSASFLKMPEDVKIPHSLWGLLEGNQLCVSSHLAARQISLCVGQKQLKVKPWLRHTHTRTKCFEQKHLLPATAPIGSWLRPCYWFSLRAVIDKISTIQSIKYFISFKGQFLGFFFTRKGNKPQPKRLCWLNLPWNM